MHQKLEDEINAEEALNSSNFEQSNSNSKAMGIIDEGANDS